MLNILPQSITIYRPTFGQDASFGITPTAMPPGSGWSAVYTSIPASICPASTSVQMLYAQRQLVVSHTIWVGDNTIAVVNGDIISDGSKLYRVTGFEIPASDGRVFKIDAIYINV